MPGDGWWVEKLGAGVAELEVAETQREEKIGFVLRWGIFSLVKDGGG
jgi:hypothetical protein